MIFVRKKLLNVLSVIAAYGQQHILVQRNEGHVSSFLSNKLLSLITDYLIPSVSLMKQGASSSSSINGDTALYQTSSVVFSLEILSKNV